MAMIAADEIRVAAGAITTAAATSSPSFGCGIAKVTTCWIAGWSISTSSTCRSMRRL